MSWPTGFEFASFQHLHVLVPSCCNDSAAEYVWGVYMPFREMVPTTWRPYDALVQQVLFIATSVKTNHRGMLLCLRELNYRRSSRLTHVAWGPRQRQCGQSALRGYMSGTPDSVSGEFNYWEQDKNL